LTKNWWENFINVMLVCFLHVYVAIEWKIEWKIVNNY
jgi:hypothetical protein